MENLFYASREAADTDRIAALQREEAAREERAALALQRQEDRDLLLSTNADTAEALRTVGNDIRSLRQEFLLSQQASPSL